MKSSCRKIGAGYRVFVPKGPAESSVFWSHSFFLQAGLSVAPGICPERTSKSVGSQRNAGQRAEHDAYLESAKERDRPTCVGTQDQRELGHPFS